METTTTTTTTSTRFRVRRYTSAIGDGWEIWDDFCDQGGTVLMFDSEVDAAIFAKALNEAHCVVYGGD